MRDGTPGRRATGAALLLALAAAAHAAPELTTVAGTGLDAAVAEHVVVDVDGDGRAEIVVIGEAGDVRVLGLTPEGMLAERTAGDRAVLVLPHPERTLFAVTDLTGRGGPAHLVTLSPDGVRAYPAVPGGGFSPRAIECADRARFVLRVGVPRAAPIARDINGDGRPDLVVPRHDACEIWLQQGAAQAGPPRFERAAVVDVEVDHTDSTDADALTDVLESAFRIPQLSIADVNGDGLADLLVVDDRVRAFHLQRPDGSIPAEPDVRVDLEMFRDTTPEAEVRLGRTLAGADEQRYESRDLDGDGIPDHVIAHRRKVWVFRGGPGGPQFGEPSAILKTAEDVTALLLVRVDADDRPDLVLVRVQVPTAAGLLRGLLAEWDVELTAVGYRGNGAAGFETTPAWRGEISVRLPALLGVIRNPDALIRRFEAVAGRFDGSLEADLDGDGTPDTLLVAGGEEPRLRAWRGRPGSVDLRDVERLLGHVLFEDAERTWTLDRLLGWLGSLAERRAERLTGGRAPDGEAALRTAEHALRDVATADLDGDGRAEVVVAYDRDDGVFVLEVLGWR